MTPKAARIGGKSGDYRNLIPGAEDLNKGNEDLINFLEQKLEQLEKNLIVKQ